MKIGIYKITSPIGKIYIGQSINLERRFSEYKNNPCKTQSCIYESIKEYGFENHKFEIIELIDSSLGREEIISILNKQESFYIEKFNSINPFGLNLTFGGENKNRTEVTKNKIRDWHKGTHLSEETKNKIRKYRKGKTYEEIFGAEKAAFLKIQVSKRMKGKKKSEDQRKKMSEWQKGEKSFMYGKHLPYKTRRKISLNNKGRINHSLCKQVDQYSLDGVFIRTYDSVAIATKSMKASPSDISNTCNGIQKSCKGYIWKYHNQKQTA